MMLRRQRKLHPVIARSSCDEAIQSSREALDCFASLAMTLREQRKPHPVCDRAIAYETSGCRGLIPLPLVAPSPGGMNNRLRSQAPGNHINAMLRWEREIAGLTSKLQGEAGAADFVGVDQKAGKGGCLAREIG
jgi:hypothetical protein